MDNLLQQLVSLVGKGNVELRCATLLVLAGLKLDNADVMKTVGAVLDHSNPVLKDYALRYFEEVQPKGAAPMFLKLLEDTDKDIQERAVRWLSGAGPAAVQPLLQHAPAASKAWQLNAARVLCAARGKAALKGLLQMLISGTDEFNKAICDFMTPMIREMGSKEQDVFYNELEMFAASLEAKQQRPAVISAIRLLGQLGRPQSRRWLCRFIGAEHPANLRSHALVALLRCLRDQDLRKDEYAKLFPLLEETEASEVTRLAVEILDAHQLPEESRPLLSRLLGSPHADVQKFALRKMGDIGSPATVRTLVEQLGDPDYRRREVAARSLRKIPEARNALIKELMISDDASKAWSIAELLPSFEAKWRKDTLDAIWKRLEGAIVAEDRIQTALLHVLKQADANYAYEHLAAAGARFLKTKKYKEAIGYLTPLKEFSEFKPENKFHLALAQLKLHSHTVASHRQHPAVELLSDLYRNSAYPLSDALKKEKSLVPEDFFSLGFSLVERPGEERGLGKDLLEHLAARFPRNKVAKSAKNKLKLIAG
jgi:HEAT repeat protein